MAASEDEDAIQLDLYLDRVLAGTDGPVATWPTTPGPDSGLATAAVLVAAGATEFHPSFRFEERLAARLRDAASGLDGELPRPGILLPFVPGATSDRVRSRHLGGVLVGGAIASGVSIASLAGAAALVVWRRARWERLI